MDLSVIIVSFNVRDYLRQCLNSVKSATDNIDCEIFVVDNSSEDGTIKMIEDEFPDIRLIINSINCGFSAANNQAIRISAGRFVLLLNPDTIVGRDSFVKCINFLDNHSDGGALGVRMINGEGKFLPESKRAFPTPLTAFFKIFGGSALFPKSPFFNRYYLPQIDSRQTSSTEVISGAFMFIRREALIISGMLDEAFFMYGEDIDLSYRLIQSGFKNYYFPETQIVHFKGKSTSRKSYKDILQFYKAMRIYARKRVAEEKLNFYFLLKSAIYLREAFALLIRFVKLTFTLKR
jgi:O-antigen biosynthesis protein